MRRETAANWPGQSEPSLLGKLALSITVPVVVSTALSMNASAPCAAGTAVRAWAGGGSDGATGVGPAGPPRAVSAPASTGDRPGTADTGRGFPAPYRWIRGSSLPGTANRTRIGRIWLIT